MSLFVSLTQQTVVHSGSLLRGHISFGRCISTFVSDLCLEFQREGGERGGAGSSGGCRRGIEASNSIRKKIGEGFIISCWKPHKR